MCTVFLEILIFIQSVVILVLVELYLDAKRNRH